MQTTPLRKTITRGFVAGAMIVMLVVGVAPRSEATTQPGVNATPGNMSSHPWSTDGCSVVADSGYWFVGGVPARFDFHHACVHHDGCYRGHWASRSTCDSWFYNDMGASCRYTHPRNLATRAICYNAQSTYYLGVRALGARAYDQRSSYIPISRYA